MANSSFFSRLMSKATERQTGMMPGYATVKQEDLRELLRHYARLDDDARARHEAKVLRHTKSDLTETESFVLELALDLGFRCDDDCTEMTGTNQQIAEMYHRIEIATLKRCKQLATLTGDGMALDADCIPTIEAQQRRIAELKEFVKEYPNIVAFYTEVTGRTI